MILLVSGNSYLALNGTFLLANAIDQSIRFGNVTLLTAFSGVIPWLFNLHFHGLPVADMYGPAAALLVASLTGSQ